MNKTGRPFTVEGLLSMKRASSESKGIFIPRHYVSLAGDYNCAALLAQLKYWFSENAFGKPRCQKNNGEIYLVKSREEWKEEICLSPKTLRRAEKELKELGIIDIELKKWNGTPTNHYYFDWDRLTELETRVLNGETREKILGQIDSDQREQSSNNADSEVVEDVQEVIPTEIVDNPNENENNDKIPNSDSDQREFSIVTKGNYPKLPKGILDSDLSGLSSNTYITTDITTESTDREVKPTSSSNLSSSKKNNINWDSLKPLFLSTGMKEITFDTFIAQSKILQYSDNILRVETKENFGKQAIETLHCEIIKKVFKAIFGKEPEIFVSVENTETA